MENHVMDKKLEDRIEERALFFVEEVLGESFKKIDRMVPDNSPEVGKAVGIFFGTFVDGLVTSVFHAIAKHYDLDTAHQWLVATLGLVAESLEKSPDIKGVQIGVLIGEGDQKVPPR
jgi:hypothetical protein